MAAYGLSLVTISFTSGGEGFANPLDLEGRGGSDLVGTLRFFSRCSTDEGTLEGSVGCTGTGAADCPWTGVLVWADLPFSHSRIVGLL